VFVFLPWWFVYILAQKAYVVNLLTLG